MNSKILTLSLFKPILIPSSGAQRIFNEADIRSFKLSIESKISDRKLVNPGKKFQLNTSSPLNINAPLCLKAPNQNAQRTSLADPGRNFSNNGLKNAIFDKVTVEKYFSKINGIRNPTDPIMRNYPENSNIIQYRDLKLCYKDYVDDQILCPIKSYDKMKTYYHMQVFGLRFQVYNVTPKKLKVLKEYDEDPTHINIS